MKTAISLPNDLFEAAEELARRLGISRSQLYRRAVEHFLKARAHDIIRESLDELYAEEDLGGRLDPAIEYAQGVSLEEDGW
jgi:predicted transcriptional regulator